MHFSTLIVHGVLAVVATASRGWRIRRDDDIIDPGQPSDCTWWEVKIEDYQDCAYLEESWHLTHSEFVEYNPTVKADCSGMQFGHSYCVEVNNGIPLEGESSQSTTTQAAEPELTKEPNHSPIQDGLINTCTSFYQAKKGDTCPKIIAEYKKIFDFNDFFKWNPAVDKDCNGIWAGYWYCVGVPGTPTSAPTISTVTSTKPTGPSRPTATQEGIISTCTAFHMATKGETCDKIVASYGTFDFDTFFKWNPAVGKDCSGIWANYYYCIGVPGSPTVKSSATSLKPTATSIQTLSPVQEGIAKNCNKLHLVSKTTTCSSIEKYYKLPFSQFLAWNPAIVKDCSGLWANYYVCVSVEGYKPSPTATAQPPATATKGPNGISTPLPMQTGMISNCNKFHTIKSTTTCDSIQNYYKISLADFMKWNPAVGSKCTGLWTNYNVCVGVIGGTPTKPSNGVRTPSPIQPGMVSNCKKFHPVASTTTCDSIKKYYKITMEQFVKWNPAVGSKCTGLWAKYHVCVSV
ncbi:unnamed protein product [Fusarium langsethiae]|nr:unnamed protein product [Fusarium langsethiae]